MNAPLPQIAISSLPLASGALPPSAAAAGGLRVVSQSPYITYALEWMGAGDRIVGVSRHDRRELPRTGGVMDPDGAMMARLGADLVIASDWPRPEALQAATPPGARVLRVGGFASMADVEQMLRDIGHAVGVADIEARVERFAAAWRAAAARVGGRGRRILLVSACTGTPYSFGRGTTLGDLFARAGFVIAETQERIHHFPAGPAQNDLAHWLAVVEPELVFVLGNRRSAACEAELAHADVRVLRLDSGLFYHPGPRLLDGLAQLREVLPHD